MKFSFYLFIEKIVFNFKICVIQRYRKKKKKRSIERVDESQCSEKLYVKDLQAY